MTKTYELPNNKMLMADVDEKHHTATVSVYALDDLVEAVNKTGHWIKTIGENGITSAVRCSKCGFEDNRYMLFRYCPDCGARMEVEKNG